MLKKLFKLKEIFKINVIFILTENRSNVNVNSEGGENLGLENALTIFQKNVHV